MGPLTFLGKGEEGEGGGDVGAGKEMDDLGLKDLDGIGIGDRKRV